MGDIHVRSDTDVFQWRPEPVDRAVVEDMMTRGAARLMSGAVVLGVLGGCGWSTLSTATDAVITRGTLTVSGTALVPPPFNPSALGKSLASRCESHVNGGDPYDSVREGDYVTVRDEDGQELARARLGEKTASPRDEVCSMTFTVRSLPPDRSSYVFAVGELDPIRLDGTQLQTGRVTLNWAVTTRSLVCDERVMEC